MFQVGLPKDFRRSVFSELECTQFNQSKRLFYLPSFTFLTLEEELIGMISNKNPVNYISIRKAEKVNLRMLLLMHFSGFRLKFTYIFVMKSELRLFGKLWNTYRNDVENYRIGRLFLALIEGTVEHSLWINFLSVAIVLCLSNRSLLHMFIHLLACYVLIVSKLIYCKRRKISRTWNWNTQTTDMIMNVLTTLLTKVNTFSVR